MRAAPCQPGRGHGSEVSLGTRRNRIFAGNGRQRVEPVVGLASQLVQQVRKHGAPQADNLKIRRMRHHLRHRRRRADVVPPNHRQRKELFLDTPIRPRGRSCTAGLEPAPYPVTRVVLTKDNLCTARIVFLLASRLDLQ